MFCYSHCMLKITDGKYIGEGILYNNTVSR